MANKMAKKIGSLAKKITFFFQFQKKKGQKILLASELFPLAVWCRQLLIILPIFWNLKSDEYTFFYLFLTFEKKTRPIFFVG